MSKRMFSTLWNEIGRHNTLIQPFESLRLFSISRVNHLPTKLEYAKLKADPERYRRSLLQISIWKRKKYREDPEHRQRANSASTLRSHKYQETSEAFRRRKAIARWVTRYTWFREQLPWKSHHPLLFAQKIKHVCAKCGMLRSDGLMLWWKSAEPESYTCHTCYTKADWNEAMPEGYEDCRTKADMVARMEQLGVSPT
jgi:hypothetical protein